jgi:hypothetical protein
MTGRCAAALCVLLAAACARGSDDSAAYASVSQAQADTIRRAVLARLGNAYDLSKPDVVTRMLSLYPTSGRVISASGGQVLTTADSLAMGVHQFWDNVGHNMRKPRWIWEHVYVDVLSPTAAVVTATYRVPHFTPTNHPHEIGGAMTEVFQKRDGQWVVIQEHLSDLPIRPADTTMTDSTMRGM